MISVVGVLLFIKIINTENMQVSLQIRIYHRRKQECEKIFFLFKFANLTKYRLINKIPYEEWCWKMQNILNTE